MALKITRAWQPFTPTAMGNADLPEAEQISCEYKTMTVDDVFATQDELDVDVMMDQEEGKQDPRTQKKNWGLMKHIVGAYTNNWQGIEVDGEAITEGEAVASNIGMDAMELLGEVVNVIVSGSEGTEDEAKNSDGQSEPPNSESATTAESVLPEDSETSVAADTAV